MTETVRRFQPQDAEATHRVFTRAVQEGAAGRYTAEERAQWLPDPKMPGDWGDWLAEHVTHVSLGPEGITGFFLLERDGYLNMTFVLPERMGHGTADALYRATLMQAQDLGLRQMTVLASRYAQGFFLRRGWRMAPELPARKGLDPRQGAEDTPLNRPMALDLAP